MNSVNLGMAEKFVNECAKLGLTGPQAIADANAVLERAKALTKEEPNVRLLELTPTELEAHMKDVSIRRHAGIGGSGDGLQPGYVAVTHQVSAEAHAAALPQLELLVEELRPRFDELATQIGVAVRTYGFTAQTTAEQVIQQQQTDLDAIIAWRNAQTADTALTRIARLMIRMVEVFGLRPNVKDYPRRPGPDPAVNYSVLFAAGSNWGMQDEYIVEGTSSTIDWYALAAEGLRLNSPAEVLERLELRCRSHIQELLAAQPETPAP